MKRFYFILISIMVSLFIVSHLQAQVRATPEKVKFFNFTTSTIKDAKLLKPDTTYKALFDAPLDTAHYVWAHDTTGDAQFRFAQAGQGDTIKEKFTDTLYTKKGQAHYLKFVPITAPSTDSVFVYGRNCVYPFYSLTYDTARTDTVILAAGGKVSKYIWTDLDSMRFRTALLGTDSVKVMHRPYNAAALADSNCDDICGVLYGNVYSKAPNATDSVAADSFGYMIVSGDAQVYASGRERNINVGDQLVSAKEGKAVKVFMPAHDTVRVDTIRNVRYLQGANQGDIITVQQKREATGAAGDTVAYGASVTLVGTRKDTLVFVALGKNGGAVGLEVIGLDSLYYTWMPAGYTGKWPNVIIGESLEFLDRDSAKIWIRLKK
uniref:Uncharacterized protein n=1 Tax=viral metagenome TaxID=1070528 RepID=A0A6H1ZIY3_9ZZZZ